jgi:hypothetical protein
MTETFVEMTQFTVPVSNKPGQLLRITEALGGKGYGFLGLASYVIDDVAFVRFTTQANPVEVTKTIEALGLFTIQTPVVALTISNSPGALTALLKYLHTNKVNVGTVLGTAHADSKNALVFLTISPAGDGIVPTKQLFDKYLNNIPVTA